MHFRCKYQTELFDILIAERYHVFFGWWCVLDSSTSEDLSCWIHWF